MWVDKWVDRLLDHSSSRSRETLRQASMWLIHHVSNDHIPNKGVFGYAHQHGQIREPVKQPFAATSLFGGVVDYYPLSSSDLSTRRYLGRRENNILIYGCGASTQSRQNSAAGYFHSRLSRTSPADLFQKAQDKAVRAQDKDRYLNSCCQLGE
jgi:hypothetical protein